MRVVSFNVNGLRAAERKGFSSWLRASRAQIVGLQEVRALPEQLPPELRAPRGWHAAFSAAERKGYSGVGLYSRVAADAIETSLGSQAFDREGRVQMARFGELLVVNAYFPKGSGTLRDNSRVPYKLAFYRALFARLEPALRRGERMLVMGDLNTAHREIDLARPRGNQHTSGFLPEERAEVDRWLRAGFIDSFRHFEPGPGHYTWWSQRLGARERNVGWRIDYVLASPAVLPFLRRARIHPSVRSSDHCPVSVDLDPHVLGRLARATGRLSEPGQGAREVGL
ncbi:MAG: exodeoxyribonuclease III, partial [Polyangiales bacterium]